MISRFSRQLSKGPNIQDKDQKADEDRPGQTLVQISWDTESWVVRCICVNKLVGLGSAAALQAPYNAHNWIFWC